MNKRKKLLFIGFYLPDDEINNSFVNDRFPAIQTHRFVRSFSKSLEYSNLLDIEYISTRPVSTYPKNSQISFLPKIYREQHIYEIGFLNLPILKLLTRLFSALISTFRSCLKCKRDVILVYSTHLPFLISGYIASKVFKVELVGLWTDPPAKTNSAFFLVKLVRRVELLLSKFLMSKFSRVISLTSHLALDFNPHKNYMVLEGIVDTDSYEDIPITKRERARKPFKISYTGSVERDYGIESIIDAVALFDEGEVLFEIYGAGSYVSVIENSTFKNVVYKGCIAPELIFDVMCSSDFLINCRSSLDLFTKYSFPSKILEYLMSETPTIMTMLDGIPEDYREYVIVPNSSSPNDIKDAISDGLNNYEAHQHNALRGKSYVLTKGYRDWSNKIGCFLIN